MSEITQQSYVSTISLLGAAVLAAGKRTAVTIARLTEAWNNRRGLSALARFDDRALADIGLSRSDLRDALSQPWWNDPTAMLDHRRGERRANRASQVERTAQRLRLHG